MRFTKLQISIFVSVLTLLLVVGGSYAWISSHYVTRADNEQIQMEYGGVIIAEYHVYKYSQELDDIIDLTTTDDPGKIVKLNGYEITPYDSIFPERNVNTPLVFEMVLLTNSIDELYLNCTCASEYKKTDPEGRRFTSNIMRIGGATESCIGIDFENDSTQEKFDKAKAYFNESTGEGRTLTKSFLTAEKSGTGYVFGDKLMELNCLIKKNTAEILPEDKRVVVYYVIDYADLLVEAQEVDQFSLIGITQQYVPFMDDIVFTGFSIGTPES